MQLAAFHVALCRHCLGIPEDGVCWSCRGAALLVVDPSEADLVLEVTMEGAALAVTLEPTPRLRAWLDCLAAPRDEGSLLL